MTHQHAPFEIHVHGDVPLRPEVTFAQLQDALKPLWTYAGARSLADAAESAYEEEPGIRFDAQAHLLTLCWTISGDEDFRLAIGGLVQNEIGILRTIVLEAQLRELLRGLAIFQRLLRQAQLLGIGRPQVA